MQIMSTTHQPYLYRSAGRRPLAGPLAALSIITLIAAWSLPLVSIQPALAQPAPEAPASSEGEKVAEPDKAAPAPSKPRRRLPTYYSRVVTAQQRTEIYEIQAQFQEQIDALLAQLQALEKQRDMQVEQVLTPDQRQQVAKMLEEARQRRAALRGPSAEPPAETDSTAGTDAGS